VPSFTAFAVVGLLERHFGDLVDYGFTASMEDDLDEIADGHEETVPWLSRFYFGNGKPGLKATVSGHLDEIDARQVNSIPVGLDGGGEEIVVRVGRYGPYLQRGEDRASVPDDLAPDELTVERAKELLAAPSGDRVLGEDPETGLPVLVRAGRYGPYVQLGEGDPGSKTKPRTSSLFRGMSPDTLSLEEALRLLSLPRVVGTDPSDGADIQALNGRFGPYLKKGVDSRSLEAEEQLFSITLDEALALFAQPKQRGGRRAPAAPLRELGADPATGGAMVVRSGRFGPYVTDGEVNASLRRGDDPDSLTAERAAELLAEKRAAAPVPARKSARGGRSTKTAKKASTKTAASTKTTGVKKAGVQRVKKAGGTKKAAPKRKAPTKKASAGTRGGTTGRTRRSRS
jgi:DNA topoisomerase-1